MAKYTKDEIPKLCRNCKWWGKAVILKENIMYANCFQPNVGVTPFEQIYTLSEEPEDNVFQADFGCIHWEGK